jgi:hypothetical protein
VAIHVADRKLGFLGGRVERHENARAEPIGNCRGFGKAAARTSPDAMRPRQWLPGGRAIPPSGTSAPALRAGAGNRVSEKLN